MAGLITGWQTVPADGFKITIPQGSKQLVASLRNPDWTIPTGVTVTVTLPDGTQIDTSTEIYDPSNAVLIQNGSLVDLCMSNPPAGDWTIQATDVNEIEEIWQFFFSTIPTADVQNTMDTTLNAMLGPDALETFERSGGLAGDSWGCWWCKAGCVALGVLAVGLIAAGLSYITPAAAVVVSLANCLWISNAAASALLVGAASAIGASVAIAIAYICSWANACPTPS